MNVLKNFYIKKINIIFVFVLLGLISISNSYNGINNDGLLYLEHAQRILNGNFEFKYSITHAFYSLIIAITHLITGLDFHLIAYLVNFIFSIITIFFFLKISELLYKDEKIIFTSGLLLLCFVPFMDSYLPMILRDHGSWTFLMIGVYFFLKQSFLKKNNYSIIWQLCFIIATLFRFENIIYLLIIPLFNVVNYKKIQKSIFPVFIQNYLILLVILIVLFLLLSIELVNRDLLLIIEGYINEFSDRLFRIMPLSTTNDHLPKILDSYQISITLAILFTIIFLKWISTAGVLNIFLIFASMLSSKIRQTYSQKNKLIIFLFISFLIPSLYFTNIYVFTSRYLMPHMFFLVLWLTPAAYYILFKKYDNKFYIKVFVLFFIVFSLVDITYDKQKPDNRDVLEFIRNNNYTFDINYGEDLRILYLVNKNVEDVIYYKDHPSDKRLILVRNKIIENNNIYKNFKNFYLIRQ